MCRKSIDFLRENFGLYAYDYLGMNYALEWILTGNFSDKEYEELKASICDMIITIETRNRSTITA